jgi:alcohol dehydrogenase class IV
MLVNETVIMRGMIASLSMAAESVISKGNNDIINTFALKSIDMIFRHLPLVYKESGNPNPRIHLSTASVMSGIAFSVAYLSTTLAISLALAARSDLDVATSMGIILPHIMEFNLTSSPGKYVQMSKVMGEDVRDITVIEAAIKAVEGIRKLELDVDIPQRLSAFNIQKSDFKAISGIAMSYPFLENAPRPLNPDETETILIAAY